MGLWEKYPLTSYMCIACLTCLYMWRSFKYITCIHMWISQYVTPLSSGEIFALEKSDVNLSFSLLVTCPFCPFSFLKMACLVLTLLNISIQCDFSKRKFKSPLHKFIYWTKILIFSVCFLGFGFLFRDFYYTYVVLNTYIHIYAHIIFIIFSQIPLSICLIPLD